MAQRSSAKHKKKSLCEQSLLLMANIIKLSFVTIDFRTPSVRSTRPQAVEKKIRSSSSAKVADHTEDLVVPESSRSQRSQEPESSSKPRSYSMEPQKGNPSYVTHEKEDIDYRAADFIRRTHEKIKKSNDLNSALKILPRKLPISSADYIVREVSLF